MISPILFIGLAGLGAFGVWFSIRLFRDVSWGLWWLVFFLPFERIPSVSIANFTIKINHLVGGITLVAWLLAILFNRRRLQPNPLIAIGGLFIAILFTSGLAAQMLSRAIAVLVATTFSMMLGFLVPQLFTQLKQLPLVLKLIGLTTLVTVLFGLYQFVGDLGGIPNTLTGLDPGYIKDVFGFPRIQAFAQEPLYLGNFLLLPISLTIALLLTPQKWFPRPLLLWFLTASGLVFALTLSRGAFVGLFGALIVLGILLGKRLMNGQTVATILAGIAIVIVGTATILGAIGPNSRSRFLDHLVVKDFNQGESTIGRLATWNQAIDLWQDAKLLGIGPGNFGPAILGYPTERPPRGWPIVNNEYFELLAETGIIGLTVFLGFFALLFARSWRAYHRAHDNQPLRAVLVGLTAAVVGILCQYLFFSTLYINPIWLTIGLLMAVQTLILQPTGNDDAT